MKSTKLYFVLLFLVATLVPTELLHYVHVVGDLTEHYEHHQDLSLTDFLTHAFTTTDKSDTKHPDHHHSPFQHHHLVSISNFVTVIPEIPQVTLKEQTHFFNEQNHKFLVKDPFILEVTTAIWQPPKIS